MACGGVAGAGAVRTSGSSCDAYRMAVERGFGFECDVYLSADGRVFTFHDGNLKRTSNINLTAEVLQLPHRTSHGRPAFCGGSTSDMLKHICWSNAHCAPRLWYNTRHDDS